MMVGRLNRGRGFSGFFFLENLFRVVSRGCKENLGRIRGCNLKGTKVFSEDLVIFQR